MGSIGAVIGPSTERWLEALRAATEAQRRIFAEHRGIEARTVYEGIGEGGDHTLVIDRLCEDTIFDQLEQLAAEGHGFVAISEERGEVELGGGGDVRVVIDPIDGSMNARRTIPSHSVSVAVASGSSMADVQLGYVHEFGSGEEFTAIRDQGALLDGERLQVATYDGLEAVGLEAAKPERVAAACAALEGKAYRIRAIGSIAISLSYVAAGRFDGMIGLRECRSVDAAAAQLIALEAGAAVAFGEIPAHQVGFALDERFEIAAARTPADLQTLRVAQEVARAIS